MKLQSFSSLFHLFPYLSATTPKNHPVRKTADKKVQFSSGNLQARANTRVGLTMPGHCSAGD
jgi:hypothetical protein